ncbi:hypothetical protein B0O99DRAFT_686195 [Bisporella sp. PMI_857]|nr:hypothetical protein B0O99DRAFT_686195 [Bisporella sp. PMI_857]
MTETFNWNLPGLDKRLFAALANLLALRNGSQIELATIPQDDPEGSDSDDESDSGSIDTSQPQCISKSRNSRLKKKVLDGLAELAANRKGGQYVACSAMREEEDSVAVWIARNEGFQQEDELFFQRLSDLLGMLGMLGTNQGEKTETELWLHMLDFYKHRLEGTYIPDLRASLKGCDHLSKPIGSGQYTEAIQQVPSLRELIFDYQLSGSTILERHNSIASQAYRLREMGGVKQLLLESSQATSATRKLWTCICPLSRLRACYEIFKSVAKKLPSFAKVDVVIVPRSMIAQDSIKNALTLKQTFEKLSLQLDLQTIQTMLGGKWTLGKAEQQFRQLQRQKLNVHAEVQMVMFLSKLGETFGDLFSYFGCSKYSCFMCSHFLKAYGAFKTRGSHGRLFKPCTIPLTTSLEAIRCSRLCGAVLELHQMNTTRRNRPPPIMDSSTAEVLKILAS